MRYRTGKYRGLTLTELMVTVFIIVIIITAIGVLFVDTHRGWLDTYAKVYGGAADDAKMSQVAFDRIVRKASQTRYDLPESDDLTVYYYDDWQNSDQLDRYARFYRADDDPKKFYVEHGQWQADQAVVVSSVMLASTVSDLEFKPTSGGIEMKLILDDGRETTTLVTTAILHNE